MKIIIIVLSFLLMFTMQINASEIWVAVNGNDRNPGTKNEPMATLLMAQRKAREWKRLNDPLANNGIRIILKGGIYPQTETLFFRPEDSGTRENPLIIESAPGEEAVISGGLKLSGWTKAKSVPGLPDSAKGKIWVTDAPKTGGRILEFRQMWVNNTKARRASTLDDGLLNRILSVDKLNEEFRIPAPGFPVNDLKQMEFVIHQWWAVAILRVKNIRQTGDSAFISFHQPESRIEFEHPWPAPFIDSEKNLNGNSAYYFVNSVHFLNQPGEWYEDLEEGKVYYWPFENVNMANSTFTVPILETLVKIGGTPDNPVSNIRFNNIQFQHTAFLRPSQMGHVPLQAGMYLLDAYKLDIPGTPDKTGLENQAWIGRQTSAVKVSGAKQISFTGCSFRHLAATGLDFINASQYCYITGNLFEDIGGTGIQAGFFGDEAFEAHLPFNPSDERMVCSHLNISNNLVTNCTNEDWGCVGISIGYANHINIEHNEVSHLNYSGICLGWGWTPTLSCMKYNRIHANHIHHFAKNMYDVGGIYTLSVQPFTEITNNYIHHLEKAPYAHIPEHYQYIYLDERSSYIKIKNNFTEKDKFFSNTPGPGNEWENNGPQVSEDIKNKAGIQKEYFDILKEKK